MEFDNKTLTKYLAEVKRVEKSRSEGADKEIRKMYKEMLSNLNGFVGEYYTKYSDNDGKLSVGILQQKGKYAAFLEEVEKNVNGITPEISKAIKKTVQDTYKACYKGMVNAVANAANNEDLKNSFKGLSIKAEVVKRAVENPVAGLTLPERLQKQRQDVIYDIKQNVANALMTGERYDTTAKKIAERLDVSYGKAMRITRTESHRVQEAGLMDGAAEVGEKVREDGLVYAAIWHNMGDSKVRPYARVHTSKGWKTYKSKTKADHVKMEGQIIEAGDDFDLGDGVKAKSPGQSGTAENDCNCRCYVEYEMMTEEEFIERGGKLKSRKSKGNAENKVENSDESGIIEAEESSPRKSKGEEHSVDWEKVNSREYSEKFTKLSSNEKVSKAIETRAKWALNNRDGIETEELYAISLKSGKEIARITNQNYKSAVKRTVNFTNKLNSADKAGEEILLIHNHPKGLPPSISDINSLLRTKNAVGITVGHNGSVYWYSRPNKEIEDRDWNVALKHFNEYSEITAMEKALRIISKKYGFEFKNL